MTPGMVAQVELAARQKGACPASIFRDIKAKCAAKGVSGPSESAVRRFLAGKAYQRGKIEKRGQPKKVTKAVVKKYTKVLERLRKKAKSKYPVTNGMVMGAAKLAGKVSTRAVTDAAKAGPDGTRFYPARKKLDRTADEEEVREEQAGAWSGRPSSFWTEKIHGVIDNKSFAVPVTPAKKALLQKQKVHGHLRKKSEGILPKCVRPKGQRGGIGVPSVNVTACVSPSTGRVIMFHANTVGKKKKGGKWTGEMAKGMYEGPLRTALKRTYGEKAKYRVIEDGDPTGYQSSKGKEGKKNAGIESWKLPPRSPEWNCLDYSIWHEIEKKALRTKKKSCTPKEWLGVLRKAAHGLSVNYVKKTCASLKKRIVATKKAKGKHVKVD